MEDHTQNLEEQILMGGRREVSIIPHNPVTRSDFSQERSFFHKCLNINFLQLVAAINISTYKYVTFQGSIFLSYFIIKLKVMRIKFNQDKWLLCQAHVGSRLLFCVLYLFLFRFFFLFLFLFRSPGSWFSRRPLKVCCGSKIIKLLSGSLLHTRNHIYSLKANWMEFYIKVLYIVIKRKGFQVMEVGINILN